MNYPTTTHLRVTATSCNGEPTVERVQRAETIQEAMLMAGTSKVTVTVLRLLAERMGWIVEDCGYMSKSAGSASKYGVKHPKDIRGYRFSGPALKVAVWLAAEIRSIVAIGF